MKENTLGMKLLMAVVTLGVLAYFGIQGWRYLSDPLTTTLAYTYEVEESMDLSGYVVRQEQVITDSSGSGLMQIQRGEGERVMRRRNRGQRCTRIRRLWTGKMKWNSCASKSSSCSMPRRRRWDRKRP